MATTAKVENEALPPRVQVAAPESQSISSSLFRYSPGLVLIAIALADSVRIADPDLWGHLYFGRAVLAQHHLILRDPYSYSAAGHFSNNHEWLADVLMAAIFNHAGVFGLALMKLACSSIVICFLAAALAETGSSPLVQFGVLIFSAACIKPYIEFRPQVFTFALLSVLMWLLARDSFRRKGRLWIAIPLLAVWANFHGGFIMGLAALGVYAAVAGLQEVVAGEGWKRALRLGAIAVAAAIATLATPYGIATWEAVGHALRNPYTRLVITEWTPLTPAMLINSWKQHPAISQYHIGLAMIAALAFSWMATMEADDLPLVGIAAVMAGAALVSSRNLPIAVIATATPLARHLPRALERRWPRFAKRSAQTRSSYWINQTALTLLSILLFVQSGLFSGEVTIPELYPASACTFMKRNNLKGNILSDFAWGDYLIWHMAPESKVFIDGRYDTVFPMEVIHQFILFNFNLPGGDQILSKFRNDFVLIKPSSPSRKLMDAQHDWKLIYQDEAARLYAPGGSAGAHISGVPVIGSAGPMSFP